MRWVGLSLARDAARCRSRRPHAGAVSEAEAARLEADLTPMGAERAGNAEGTIPAWTGGITAPPPGYQPGAHHPDPYPGDRILYTVTAARSRGARLAAMRRPEGAAARSSRELAPERLPDPPLRLLPRVGLRGRARQRDARACRAHGKGLGRGRAGRPAVSDSAERHRGDVEPQPALARRAGRAQRRDRRRDAPGKLPRGPERADARHALRRAAAGCLRQGVPERAARDPGEDDRARADRRRRLAGDRADRPDERSAQVVELQPRPAAGVSPARGRPTTSPRPTATACARSTTSGSSTALPTASTGSCSANASC